MQRKRWTERLGLGYGQVIELKLIQHEGALILSHFKLINFVRMKRHTRFRSQNGNENLHSEWLPSARRVALHKLHKKVSRNRPFMRTQNITEPKGDTSTQRATRTRKGDASRRARKKNCHAGRRCFLPRVSSCSIRKWTKWTDMKQLVYVPFYGEHQRNTLSLLTLAIRIFLQRQRIGSFESETTCR